MKQLPNSSSPNLSALESLDPHGLLLPICLVEFDNGQVISPEPVPPAQIDERQAQIEEFFRSKPLSVSTQRSYRRQFDRFLSWTAKAWQDINHRDILRYKLYLEHSTLSPASVAAALVALKSLFKGLRSLGYVTENPTIAVKIPKNFRNASNPLSKVQMLALYKALEEHKRSRLRDTAVLEILRHGLSAAEAAGLNIENYDGQQLHVPQAKAGSNSTVLLNAEARRAIETYLEQRKAQGDSLVSKSPLFLNEAVNARCKQPQARYPQAQQQDENRDDDQTENLTMPERLSYRGIYNLVKNLGRLAQANLVQEGRSIEAAQLRGIQPHQLRYL
jgi:site-specific recombinase XerD